MSKKSFGDYVKCARYSQGITCVDLAKRTGISQTQLRNIENGRCTPKPKTFTAIVDCLGLDRQEAASILQEEWK